MSMNYHPGAVVILQKQQEIDAFQITRERLEAARFFAPPEIYLHVETAGVQTIFKELFKKGDIQVLSDLPPLLASDVNGAFPQARAFVKCMICYCVATRIMTTWGAHHYPEVNDSPYIEPIRLLADGVLRIYFK